MLRTLTEDKLVVGGLAVGDGRTKPTSSHAEFVRAIREWIEESGAAPEP